MDLITHKGWNSIPQYAVNSWLSPSDSLPTHGRTVFGYRKYTALGLLSVEYVKGELEECSRQWEPWEKRNKEKSNNKFIQSKWLRNEK